MIGGEQEIERGETTSEKDNVEYIRKRETEQTWLQQPLNAGFWSFVTPYAVVTIGSTGSRTIPRQADSRP